MSHEQIIRAWKDSAYRNSLSAEELAQLPANPAGESLTEAELDTVVGGGCAGGHGGYGGRGGYGGYGGGYGGGSSALIYCSNYEQRTNQTINQLSTLSNVQVGITLLGPVNNYSSCNNRASNSTGY
ncbi:MAG TPA: mersacidin/lichenicidin family type 2 lantibiotic [Ktedonobacteraceae bacterium]|jgi:mersacidin/lichenicidin family type 2 lantibiotic